MSCNGIHYTCICKLDRGLVKVSTLAVENYYRANINSTIKMRNFWPWTLSRIVGIILYFAPVISEKLDDLPRNVSGVGSSK
jgi:hypothetical protein